ncbi:MAG: hypothetical protein AVDCRST_MAG55-1090 [uncultured Rubrobacteraceae bacterium]|uniref:Uncharacterized protein n=1 Tax=uncultured Rubrobacteraceae bacterium TaxID=349277 RepID=A0A6J4PDV9_9ACTN|nr:MAG: hypothetical protein AVDCRST_MAG55-1090 [uncultured Rubrobacteraceae bacterium]
MCSLALLVVAEEDAAGELGRGDVDGLDALARVAARIGADKLHLPRVLRVAEVDDVDAVVLAGDRAPRGQVGIAHVDTDARDLLRHDVLEKGARRAPLDVG